MWIPRVVAILLDDISVIFTEAGYRAEPDEALMVPQDTGAKLLIGEAFDLLEKEHGEQLVLCIQGMKSQHKESQYDHA